MSTDKPSNATPTPAPGKAPAPAPAAETAETIAAQFVAQELETARRSLKRTRLVGIVLLLFVCSYMSFITVSLMRFLEPASAAEIAVAKVSDEVDLKASEIAAQLKVKIPSLVSQLPDYALGKLPEYREQIENKLESDLSDYCLNASKHMGKQLDDFLVQHKDNIAHLLKSADDREAIKLLVSDYEDQLLEYLQQKPEEGGESIQEKMDMALEALRHVEQRMERLATAKDLTAEEKKTRRAIAIVSKKLAKAQVLPSKSVQD